MALARTKLRFSLPYKATRTSALALLELVARREARSENDSFASVPQAPYASINIKNQKRKLFGGYDNKVLLLYHFRCSIIEVSRMVN